ncbi:BPSS1780 family membrane protein [Janthinobacterium sp. 1_2014MBL_MicDiv]|uniref:BPSS1780 family membrane protein n=1 Tax=Janthinobacterium sp. 1_2014MBL_MicDiv TaxID=1644131 RepID=UPI0008F51489|nr:BPSS1780 family membrane protein [Janthinobacterium sp. 1_2014MBL_MicDiv]APA70189.1 membrane protein [Janthinobacterium sp. 1_2014MBL_MicDiv]
MEKLPASTGWQWVKQGFGLFRKQPGGLSMLFLGYMFCMLAVSIVPLLGQLLPVILVPVFSVAFVQGCLNIDLGKRVLPSLLISGFRKPAFPVLLGLGVLYILTAIVAIGASTLVDGGVLWQLATGQLNPQTSPDVIRESNVGMAILTTIVLYVPAAMAFCFAAPLIYWKQTGLGKALFFSFFAVWRSLSAFVVFASTWFAISVVTSQLLFLIVGRTPMAVQLMMPLSMILTVIMHCSFYAAYRQIFGVPVDESKAVSLDKPND